MDGSLTLGAAKRAGAGPVRGAPRRGRGRVSAGAVLDTAVQGYLVFDARLRVVLCNPQAARLLGVARQAGRGSLSRMLQGSSTLGAGAQLALMQAAQAARRGDGPSDMLGIGGLQVQVRPLSAPALGAPDAPPGVHAGAVARPGAVVRPGDDAHAADAGQAGDGAFWLISLEAAAAVTGAARSDALTGVADRGSFLTALSALVTDPPGADGVTVLLVDLNGFRTVNETLGASIGDELLRVVAQRLRSALRTGDLIGRAGGDQFAVAAGGFPRPDTLAARLVELLSRPYVIEGQVINASVSVGIATAASDGGPAPARVQADRLLHAAGMALRQAKSEGRRTICVYHPGMQADAQARRLLESDLRTGLALQQFELYYQPQTALDTGALIGFEALLRWRHPDRGLVPPDAFIPTLEAIGLIVQVGEWVLRTACRAAAGWPGRLAVAVNVSAVQLMSQDRLPRAVASALAESGLPAERLELEITESALAHHAEIALQALQAVRAQGVSVSMDDFGIGYSSLSQLRRFPFDKIKIDRSFVRDLVADRGTGTAEAVAVVRAIAALGASLGLTTTAEGVETLEQQRLVRAEGCTNMQGYLVSRPIPAGEVAGLIARMTQAHH